MNMFHNMFTVVYASDASRYRTHRHMHAHTHASSACLSKLWVCPFPQCSRRQSMGTCTSIETSRGTSTSLLPSMAVSICLRFFLSSFCLSDAYHAVLWPLSLSISSFCLQHTFILHWYMIIHTWTSLTHSYFLAIVHPATIEHTLVLVFCIMSLELHFDDKTCHPDSYSEIFDMPLNHV